MSEDIKPAPGHLLLERCDEESGASGGSPDFVKRMSRGRVIAAGVDEYMMMGDVVIFKPGSEQKTAGEPMAPFLVAVKDVLARVRVD